MDIFLSHLPHIINISKQVRTTAGLKNLFTAVGLRLTITFYNVEIHTFLKRLRFAQS